jgi:hypothetical protein
MNRLDFALIGLAAVILASIIVVSVRSEVVLNGTTGDLYGIDLFGLTHKAQRLPEDQFAAH